MSGLPLIPVDDCRKSREDMGQCPGPVGSCNKNEQQCCIKSEQSYFNKLSRTTDNQYIMNWHSFLIFCEQKIIHLKNHLKSKDMKLQTHNLLNNLSTTEVEKLLTVTRETVAPMFKKDKKIFTAARFYEIQKRKRNFPVRRSALA